jgi:hypothetical protein
MLSLRITKICTVAIGAMMIWAGPALAAPPTLSATATISGIPDGANYDYTVKVTDTGSSNIGTFWFAWTPPEQFEYDFLPNDPSTAAGPSGWIANVSDGFPGTSIEYYNSNGTALSTGQTGTFTFTTTDSPTTLQGTVFNVFPITESFIYAGAPEVGSDAQVNPTFVVPEPSSAALLGVIGCGLAARRRRRALV